jgi:HK97 family phage major capsid protein/HK97 family phage prohead protease
MTGRLEVKAEVSIDEAGAISGLAWPFDQPDSVGDVIEKGAFELPNAVPMLLEHNTSGAVGVWTGLTQTDDGLEVKGQLFVEAVEPANEVRQLFRQGKVKGLSIGFRADAFEPLPGGGRKFSSVTLTEVSLCRRPVHPGARITSIKSQQPEETNMDHELTASAQTAEAVANDNVAALSARLDRLEAKAKRPAAANDNADQPSFERKAFTSYLRSGAERLGADEQKSLMVGSNADGGYLAPEAFGNELIKLLNEHSPIRQYARVVGISAPEIVYPRRVTGTAAKWVSEIGDREESGMTFEQVRLTPFELATFTDVSNQLLADNAYGLESELLADFAESFGITEGAAFVKGTGIGQPNGLLTAAGIQELKTGVAAGFPAANPADVIIAMFHAIATPHAHNGVWLMNRKTLGAIRQWKDATGRYLVLDPVTAGGASTLLGRPIVEVPDMDDIGAGKFPILFGDLSGYRIVDRLGLDVLRDPYTIKLKGQTRFHAWKRVGADITHPDRFVKLKVAA